MKIVTVLFLLASLAGCNSNNPSQPKTGLEGNLLPATNLLLSDGTTRLNTAAIPFGSPIVVFLYNPHCPFCRAQMGEITSDMKDFAHVRFYLLTSAPFADMQSFYKDFQLQKYQNVVAGVDSSDFFGKYFKAQYVPYMAVYNNQKKLKRVFIGKSNIGDLKDVAVQ
jgi:thiol-disulfide isomerase/thioredoxin